MQQFLISLESLKSGTEVTISIQMLCELAVKGDQQEPLIFEYDLSQFSQFMESKVLELMLKTMRKTKDCETINVILFSVGMLISNVINHQTYILSNPVINEFIIFEYNFAMEETLDYYANFIKQLSLKITPQNISLFYNQVQINQLQKFNYFPLLICSQMLYDHRDQMIRATVQNTLLQILQNSPPELEKFLSSYPFLQVLVNYIMNQDEEQYMLFRDIYSKCAFLHNVIINHHQIIDNLFLHALIIPWLNNLNMPLKKITKFIEGNLSHSLNQGIIALLFKPEIVNFTPITLQKQQFDLDELQEYCKCFFDTSPIKHSHVSMLFQSLQKSITSRQNTNQSSQIEEIKQMSVISQLISTPLYSENIIAEPLIQNLYRRKLLSILNTNDQDELESLLRLIECITLQGAPHVGLSYEESLNDEKIQMIINLFDCALKPSTTIRNFEIIMRISEILDEGQKDYYMASIQQYICDIETSVYEDHQFHYEHFEPLFNGQYSDIQILENEDLHWLHKRFQIINIGYKKKWLKVKLRMHFECDPADSEFQLQNDQSLVIKQYQVIYGDVIESIRGKSLKSEFQFKTPAEQNEYSCEIQRRISMLVQETIKCIIQYLHELKTSIKQ